MKVIDTRVDTYNPESVPFSQTDNTQHVVMVFDETGTWVHYRDYEDVVDRLKQRITYLENVCEENTRMLTGD